MSREQIMAMVMREGAHHAALVAGNDIVYDPIFRDICAKNTCGGYGKCYMCPPDIGDIHELIAIAQTYDRGVLYQTISTLEDSFDIEGMTEAGNRHNQLARRIKDALPRDAGLLHLSTGSCKACERCAKRDNLPCAYPDKAMSSLEAYGIDVYNSASAAGLKYINGTNTVTYFGLVLFMEDAHA